MVRVSSFDIKSVIVICEILLHLLSRYCYYVSVVTAYTSETSFYVSGCITWPIAPPLPPPKAAPLPAKPILKCGRPRRGPNRGGGGLGSPSGGNEPGIGFAVGSSSSSVSSSGCEHTKHQHASSCDIVPMVHTSRSITKAPVCHPAAVAAKQYFSLFLSP